jgi:tetratricopeptide (TPR) repeat protein
MSTNRVLITVASTLVFLSGCASKNQQVIRPIQVGAPLASSQNYLHESWDETLRVARKRESDAKSPIEKAIAVKTQAAALDSLGRSKEALITIDRATSMIPAPQPKPFAFTKASILLSLNDPVGALALLKPILARVKEAEVGRTNVDVALMRSLDSEGFFDAALAYMQLERWQDAVHALEESQDLIEGRSFQAYKALYYRYIRARTNDPLATSSRLESYATALASYDVGYRSSLLSMWNGSDNTEELAERIAAIRSGADRQDALAEFYFFRGAYLKYVKKDDAGALSMKSSLDHLAPYGAVEWTIGSRLLSPEAVKSQ